MKKQTITLLLLAMITVTSCNQKDALKIAYSGEDISQNVSIERDKQSKKAELKLDIDGQWSLYAGKSVESIDLNQPILTGDTKGTFPLDVDTLTRSYFQVVSTKGNAILSEKHLPMTGGFNFRDMGGLKNKEGRFVKWGKVFRTDDLHSLTKADEAYLCSLPLKTIVDFRADEERKQEPDVIPTTVDSLYELSITPGDLLSILNSKETSEEMLLEAMRELNRQLVSDTAWIEKYKTYFKLLQEDKTPLFFHCSAGKDRTGMGAALFLLSLGVDQETIMNDYILSNKYLGDKYAEYIAQRPELKPLLEVNKSYLQAGLDQILKENKSYEAFLTQKLGVDLQKMQTLYLY